MLKKLEQMTGYIHKDKNKSTYSKHNCNILISVLIFQLSCRRRNINMATFNEVVIWRRVGARARGGAGTGTGANFQQRNLCAGAVVPIHKSHVRSDINTEDRYMTAKRQSKAVASRTLRT